MSGSKIFVFDMQYKRNRLKKYYSVMLLFNEMFGQVCRINTFL